MSDTRIIAARSVDDRRRIKRRPSFRLPDPRVVVRTPRRALRALAASDELAPYLAFLAAIADAQRASPAASAASPRFPRPRSSRARASSPCRRSTARRSRPIRRCAIPAGGLFEALATASKPEAAEAALAHVRRPRTMRRWTRMIDSGPRRFHSGARRWPSTSTSRPRLQVHFAGWRRSWTPRRWCRWRRRLSRLRRTAGRFPDRRAGTGPRARATPPARCARPCGTKSASNASSAARPRASATRKSTGRAGPSRPRPATSAAAIVKVLYQHKDIALDPVADDVASLGLDQLLRGSAYRRAPDSIRFSPDY